MMPLKRCRTLSEKDTVLPWIWICQSFFDTVNHDVLMNRVAKHVRDKRVLSLIGKYLRAGVMVNGRLQSTPTGVPQGSLCKALHNEPYAKKVIMQSIWLNCL